MNPNVPKEMQLVKRKVDFEKMAIIVKGKKLYNCMYCTFITGATIMFKNHILSHKRVENLFVCKFCNVNLHNHSGLKEHFNQVHPGLELYHCNFCSFSKKTKRSMLKHLKNHLNYYCDYCHFGTNNYRNMKLHLLGHQKRNDFYNCDKCIFRCSTTAELTKHMEEHCKTEQLRILGEIDQVDDMHYSVGHTVKTEINYEDVAESDDILTKKQSSLLKDTGHIEEENHSENYTEVLARNVEEHSETEQLCILGELDQVQDIHCSMGHTAETEINKENVAESEDVLIKQQSCSLEDTCCTEEEKHSENYGNGLEFYCNVEQSWASSSSQITSENTSTPTLEDDFEEVRMAALNNSQNSKSYENPNNKLGESASFPIPEWSLWGAEPRISTGKTLGTIHYIAN